MALVDADVDKVICARIDGFDVAKALPFELSELLLALLHHLFEASSLQRTQFPFLLNNLYLISN